MIEDDKRFIQYIKELKNLGAKAIKLELESEYLPEFFCKDVSNVLKQNSINLILKTGGFSSYNDIKISKNINADTIVAPMTETPYALKKFIETIRCVYSLDEIKNKHIYINIETVSGIKNLDDILNSKYSNMLEGVVIGRGDLISSFDMPDSSVNSIEMEKIIIPIIQKCKKENKNIILGGQITSKSVDFLKRLYNYDIFGFETRKVFFDSNIIKNNNLKIIINKAVEFEICYLKLLSKILNQNCENIENRIQILKKRLLD